MAGQNRKATAFGIVFIVLGLLLVWAGLAPLSQYRDADGYLLSDSLTVDRSSSAVITNDITLLRGHLDCAGEETFLLDFFSPDDVRVHGAASGSGALLIAIAPADGPEGYLDGVTHDEITEWGCNVDEIVGVEYTRHQGTRTPGAPDDEQFWATSTMGSGEMTLDWTIEDGDWAVVIMNADASPGVSADLRFGALAPSNLDAFAWTSFACGLIALIGGGLLLYFGLRRGRGSTSLDAEER